LDWSKDFSHRLTVNGISKSSSIKFTKGSLAMKDLNSKDNQRTPTPATLALHRSLKSTAIATARIADAVLKHPSEISASLESAEAINEKLGEVLATASDVAESSEKLKMTAEETIKASDWIDGKVSCEGCSTAVQIANFGRVVKSFSEL
jgi:hypothetical protein